jgi:hypothetical protein
MAENRGFSTGAIDGAASGHSTSKAMPSSLTICWTLETKALASVSGRRRQSKLICAFSGMMLIL